MNGAPARGGTNLGIGLIVALPALSAVLWAAGVMAAVVTGRPAPEVGWTQALAVVTAPADPGSALQVPGLNPMVYWGSTLVLLLLVVGVGWRCRGLFRLGSAAMVATRAADPHRRPGTADRAEVRRVASARTLRSRAPRLRPSLHKPYRPEHVGYRLGSSHGQPVWTTVEDSMLLIGPPRSGKGLHVVIPTILDAPGAVICTSTRPDNLTATLPARERVGPVALFDPQRLAPVPVQRTGMRWSLSRGCEDPLTAMIRASGLAASTGLGGAGVENGGFWEGKTKAAIQCLLHAAALDGRGAVDLYQWALSPAVAVEAVRILQTHHRAAHGWAESLDAMVHADPRTRDSIWHGVSLAFAALADPRVLDAVSPRPGEVFDPASFLEQRGTLYLLFTASGVGSAGALVSALIEDVVETARRLAAGSPGARLEPPLLLSLDEIGNLALLPSLPTLMAEGGGTGITTMPVLQSLAQARQSWGEHKAHAIWDSAIVKIILGGAGDSRYLQELSTLVGEIDERTDSMTIDHYGATSTQRSMRRVPILPPEALRMLPFGTGVLLLRSARPIITRLRRWIDRPDGPQLQNDQRALETRVHHHDSRPGNLDSDTTT